jgi:hypothetical protein
MLEDRVQASFIHVPQTGHLGPAILTPRIFDPHILSPQFAIDLANGTVQRQKAKRQEIGVKLDQSHNRPVQNCKKAIPQAEALTASSKINCK